MQRLPIDLLRPGMTLAEGVRDSRGRIMIGSCMALTETHISYLKRRSVKSVQVLGIPFPGVYQSPGSRLKNRLDFLDRAFEHRATTSCMNLFKEALKTQALMRYKRDQAAGQKYANLEIKMFGAPGRAFPPDPVEDSNS